MLYADLYAEFLVYVFGEVLCGVDAAVLAAGTSEGEHQRCEAALYVACHVGIGQLVYRLKEGEYLTVILKESYHGFVETCQLLVWLIAPRVVGAAAVEDIAATVSALVLGDALVEREGEHLHHERTLAVILREGGLAVRWVGRVGVVVGGLEAVLSCCGLLGLHGKLRQLRQLFQQVDEVGVGEVVLRYDMPEVLNGWRYALYEVCLALKVPPEAVCPQDLKGAEQHEELQPFVEALERRHLRIVLQRLVVFLDELFAQRGGIAR